MINILKSQNKTRQIFIAGLAAFTLTLMSFVLFPSNTYAATINIAGACTLDDAVASVNAGSDQSGCTGVGAYGTNDIIDIPAGVHNYSSTARVTSKTVVIQGAGMGQTIIDLGGNNGGILFDNSTATTYEGTIKDLSIKNGNDATIEPAYINGYGYSVAVQRVELYSENSSLETDGVIRIKDNSAVTNQSILLEDVYMHDLKSRKNFIDIYASEGGVMTNNIVRNVTAEDISINQGLFMSLSTYDTGGDVSGVFENISLQNVDLTAQGAYFGSNASLTIGTGTSTVNLILRNVTTRMTSVPSTTFGHAVAIAVAVPGGTANSNLQMQNNLFTSNTGSATQNSGCSEVPAGVGGTENASVISLGGNLSDTDLCDSYFTAPNDQGNIPNLASTLGPLQNNGGITKTFALLTGSPAIDNGITNTATTDQRGIARPQGASFDSGAYEFVLAATDTNNDNTVSPSTLAETGQGVQAIAMLASSILTVTILLSRTLLNRSKY